MSENFKDMKMKYFHPFARNVQGCRMYCISHPSVLPSMKAIYTEWNMFFYVRELKHHNVIGKQVDESCLVW